MDSIGCIEAIYALRKCVKSFVSGGDTACIATLDITKAFPRSDHNALLIKLLNKGIPIEFINLLKVWFYKCNARVKWNGNFSANFFYFNRCKSGPSFTNIRRISVVIFLGMCLGGAQVGELGLRKSCIKISYADSQTLS